MKYRICSAVALRIVLFGTLIPLALSSASLAQSNPTRDTQLTWSTSGAEHVYGFPDTKSGKKGTLVLSADTLTFTDKASNSSIPRSTILAVSNGSDRVELFGTTGRIVRMMIPDGGGLAAAAVMHHRVGMLTIDFVDAWGGRHAAVFNMPPAQAEAGVALFSQTPVASQPPPSPNICANRAVTPGSVLVATPNWNNAQVPAAYRALVYEHVVNRLQGLKGVSRVYRDGSVPSDGACSAYTVRISVRRFKQGNQIERASLGPVGMFVGATQLSFDFKITDPSGRVNQSEQVKASIRMESESTGVADKLAKALAKQYLATLKSQEAAAPNVQVAEESAFR